MTTNNFIITGIPRSGTTLLCSLVNRISNVVCFNEVAQAYNVPMLPAFFTDMHERLTTGQPVPMDVDSQGEIITDTQVQTDHSHEAYYIDLDPEKPLFIGSKINWPYLSQMARINGFKYDAFAVVRNPVYAIASWNRHKKNINEAHVMPEDFSMVPRYSKVPFRSDEKYGRQAEVWNVMARMILENFPRERIVKYEDLVSQTPYRLMHMCSQMGAEYSVAGEMPALESHNYHAVGRDKFPFNADIIGDAVREYAPLALELGYRI